MPTDNPVLELLRQQLTQSSAERQAQAEAFQRAILALRWELHVIVLVALLPGAARDGVMARLGMPGVTVETHTDVVGAR